MDQQVKNFAAPFSPQNIKYSLDEIEMRIKTFIKGFQEAKNAEFLGKIGVLLKSTGTSDYAPLFETPFGDIKVDFEKRLEGQYLGVAATFSFKNKKGDDEEPFFVVFLNHEARWSDSSGYQFKTGNAFEPPESYEFVHLMQRVLSKRLQIQDSKLFAI